MVKRIETREEKEMKDNEAGDCWDTSGARPQEPTVLLTSVAAYIEQLSIANVDDLKGAVALADKLTRILFLIQEQIAASLKESAILDYEQKVDQLPVEKQAAFIDQLTEFLQSRLARAAQAIKELTQKGDSARDGLAKGEIDVDLATAVLEELERALEIFKNAPLIEARFEREMAYLGDSVDLLKRKIDKVKSAAKA